MPPIAIVAPKPKSIVAPGLLNRMNTRTLIALGGLLIASLSAQAQVFTTYTLPSDTTQKGTFTLDYFTLNSISRLTPGTSYTYNVAWTFFTPTTTGTYSFGIQNANYDPVMILYSGLSSFNYSDPSIGALALNDDGGQLNFNGLAINSGLNPLILDQNLTAGANYLVAITTYASGNSVTLPASFFVYGASTVGIEGQPAIPEPSTYAALAGLAALGLVAYRRRRAAA